MDVHYMSRYWPVKRILPMHRDIEERLYEHYPQADAIKALQTNPNTQSRTEPALELPSRAASSVGVTSPLRSYPNTGRNSRGGWIKKKKNILHLKFALN